ncbi:MAG: nitroreductase family deazaflavin-dependent oxidoreductase [Acidimicrobiales bacterium]
MARRIFHLPTRLYDWHLGWLLGRRFLRLTHVGRRSGRTYHTVLEVIGSGHDELYVMAGFGGSADWYQNLQQHPALEVAVGRRRFAPAHRNLDLTEAASVLGDYERRNRLMGFAVRRVLSRLVGWPYDGSPDARTRIVRELPIVAFALPADGRTRTTAG